MCSTLMVIIVDDGVFVCNQDYAGMLCPNLGQNGAYMWFSGM